MKSPYTPEFLKKQKHCLHELREAIEGNRPEKPTIEGTPDEIDAASNEADFDFALSMLSSNSNAIQDINLALSKIDKGTYGICEASNKTIPKERLQAIPFARFTVECQREVEKMNSRTKSTRESIFTLDEDSDQELEDIDGPSVA